MIQPVAATESVRAPRIVCGLLVAAVCANALLFAVHAANPLIVSDEWHFVDTIVRSYATGQFELADLFAKRGALDHSQPLRKLILLMHYRWFGLDFTIEAVVGVLAAFLNIGLFWLVARHGSARFGWVTALLFAALVAIYLSLNSSTVFSWPLLTLSYTSHSFVLAFCLATWWAAQSPGTKRLALVFVAGLVMGIVADDTAAVATAAALGALGIQALRSRGWRELLLVGAAIIVAHAAYQGLYAVIIDGGGAAAGKFGIGERIGSLWADRHEAWRWLATPLAASIAHRVQLRDLLGSGNTLADELVAGVIAIAHIWFWWRAFRGQRNASSFMATMLMLLFYGLLSAMLLARISQHGGSEYLWQPRYVMIFQWNLIALLLMALAQRPDEMMAAEKDAMGMARGRKPMAGAAILVLALQLPLSYNSWNSIRYLENFRRKQAEQMFALARNPANVPGRCVATMIVCRFPPARRASLIDFLREHQLNVFSARFRSRHDFESVVAE